MQIVASEKSATAGRGSGERSMAEPLPETLLAPLADLGKWLEATNTQAIIVGGVAASFLGRPRFTQDIDALAILAEHQWEAALAKAPAFGIVPRIEKPIEFARQTRVLLLRHVKSAIDIDVIIGGLPFEQDAVEQGRGHRVGKLSFRLPRVEDLLVMKAVAHRPQDLQDIEGLLDAHPEADLASARRWVREFASATAMSDLINDFERILERRKPGG